MSNAADVDTKEELIWSTWEELLLAFAVKRHGLKDWDTVAMELQNRQRSSSLPTPTSFTPQICKNKYRKLRRRFTNHHDTTTPGGGGGGRGSENNELPCEVQSDDDENDGLVGGGGGDSDSFPWLEELRKLRVAELKQEVHRYDLSIRSLQMKVKTMEEERVKSLKDENNDQNDEVKQPDLDKEVKQDRPENEKNNDKDEPEEVAGKSVSGDCENMSFNESNSTESKRGGSKAEPGNEPAEGKPGSELKPAGGEVSCNDSSTSQEREKGGGDLGELRDSVSESKEGTKESSDVQSSASLLTRKRKRGGGGVDGGGGGAGGDGDGAAFLLSATASIKRDGGEGDAEKSEPSAAGFLDKIRSHKHAQVFERWLEIQDEIACLCSIKEFSPLEWKIRNNPVKYVEMKTEEYKSTIRRHVDLETVQARMDGGSYSSWPTKFYVDLLLLFTNAIVFFPKSSPESLAAEELRKLVMQQLKKNSSHPSPEPISSKPEEPKPEPERSYSLLARHKSTNPIIVSRKRSSISAEASSSSANNVEKQPADDKPLMNSRTLMKSPLSTSNEEEDSARLKIKEKPVTGVRSMRSSKGRPQIGKPEATPNSSNNKSSSSQQPGSKDKGDKAEATIIPTKGDKKKSEGTTSAKKRGAADFLKRMKKNSPAKGTLVEALKSSQDSSISKGGKKDQQKKNLDKRKDGPVRRSSGGRGGQKHAKEEGIPSKRSAGRLPKKGKDVVVSGGKRGREGGEGEGSSKRPKKRPR